MKNIRVSNLDPRTSAAAIRSLFQAHGTVQHVKLMTDSETGASRGFAFVEMADVEADRAIAALNGAVMDGCALTVIEGRPKLHLRSEVRERRVPRL